MSRGVLKSKSIEPEQWERLAEDLFERGRISQAAQYYLKLLTHFGDNPRYRENAAVCYYNLGNRSFDKRRWHEAIRYYERARAIDPAYTIVLYNLGLAYGYVADHGRSIMNLINWLEVRPDDPEAHLAVGFLYWDQANSALAKRHLAKYLELQPEGKNASVVRRLLSEVG